MGNHTTRFKIKNQLPVSCEFYLQKNVTVHIPPPASGVCEKKWFGKQIFVFFRCACC